MKLAPLAGFTGTVVGLAFVFRSVAGPGPVSSRVLMTGVVAALLTTLTLTLLVLITYVVWMRAGARRR
jgi:biopolymer transport protein ExbB/TolQ